MSSTSAWAKGVRYDAGAVHLSYIYTVSRFVFDYERYVGALRQAQDSRVPDWLARPVVGSLARWDVRAAQRPTAFVAISHIVAERVRRYYGREASVLHPPVDIERFTPSGSYGDYFFIASRLLPYKRIELAIDAANEAGVPLVVAGTGPSEAALRARAQGTTTTMLGYVDDVEVARLLARARAAILPGEEDFGLVPVEAAAAGRPAIAYRGGGALETIVAGRTGEFFEEATPASLAQVLRAFDPARYDPKILRAHATAFAPEPFVAAFRERVAALLR